MLLEFLYIFIFLFIGDGLSHLLGISVPGTVIAMILLFIALLIGIIRLDQIEKGGNTLLGNMAIFFIPPGVSLVSSMDMLEGNWIKVIGIMVVTTVITIGVTGRVIQFIIGRTNNGKADN